jgi:hypothetical protein
MRACFDGFLFFSYFKGYVVLGSFGRWCDWIRLLHWFSL